MYCVGSAQLSLNDTDLKVRVNLVDDASGIEYARVSIGYLNPYSNSYLYTENLNL